MQPLQDKIKTLTGFAIKAGKVIFGADNIYLSGKRKYVILVCRTASERTVSRLINNCSSVPILKCKYTDLSEIVFRENCKVLAVTDRQMSQAMLNSYNNGMYDLISEGK